MKFSFLALLVLSVACSGPFKATENSTEFFKGGGNENGFIPLTSGAAGGQAAGTNGGNDNGGNDNGSGGNGGSSSSGSSSGGVGSASGGTVSGGASSSGGGNNGNGNGATGSADGGTASGGSESGGTYTGGYNGFGTGGASSSGGTTGGGSTGGGVATTGGGNGGTSGNNGSAQGGAASTGSASGGTVSGGSTSSGGNNGGYNGFGTGGSSSSGGSSSAGGAGSASGGTVSGGSSSSGGNSGGYNGFGTGGASTGGSETGSSSAGGYNGGYNGSSSGGADNGGSTGGNCHGKVKVCHREGNGSSHTIEIACPALPAHLAHGDTQGECASTSTSGGSGGGYVCDPMGENPPGTVVANYGLVGEIWDGKGKINKFEDATKKGDKMPYTIYMSQLNVPTRLFNEGFAATDGKLVMNSQSQPLFENFAIEFTSNLVLRPEDEEGYYQIGTLADDGVRVDITPINDKQMTLAQADFETPTKFTCGKKLVRMERNKKVPVKIRYFQGPRYHIALVMLWRKVKPLSSSSQGCHHEEPPKEVKCGIAGNKYWFDPDNSSTPMANYLELIDPSKRQVPWKLVQHQNFLLNSGDSNEECQE